MAGGSFIQPTKSIITSAALNATGTVALTGANVNGFRMGDCFALGLEVTATSGTSQTCDVVLQTSLDGTNWIDLPLRFTQKTTATTTGTPEWLVFRMGLGQNEVALAQVTADTGGQLAKNCIFNPDQMRAKATLAATSHYTLQFNLLVLPVQRVA